MHVVGEGGAESDPDEDSVEGKPSDQAVLLGMAKGQLVELLSVVPEQHFTKPPPRYTEASLVKALEELGIGRPSTYASILKVLQVSPHLAAVQAQVDFCVLLLINSTLWDSQLCLHECFSMQVVSMGLRFRYYHYTLCPPVEHAYSN